MRLFLLLSLLLSWSSFTWGQTFEVIRLGDQVNTSLEEISPILVDNGQTLIFTRIASPEFNQTLIEDNKNLSKLMPKGQFLNLLGGIYSAISGETVTDATNSRFNQDVFIAKKGIERFAKIIHPSSPLNNALPNSICSATPDPDKFVITNKFYKEGGMSAGFSTIKRNASGKFEFPEPIEIVDFYTNSEEVGFMMAPDGNTIIMSLDRDDSFGDLDLYVSFKIEDNYYSTPLNLGPSVNTKYREIAPNVSKNNKRLFFSSNRGPKRDFDIYTIERQAFSWQKWDKLKRFPEPINSEFDDSQPFFVEKTDELFFISTRSGNSDIFQVNLNPEVKDLKQLSIKGKIIDAVTKKTIRSMLKYGADSDEELDQFFNSYTGHFNVNLVFKDNYRFMAHKNGYVSSEIILDPDQFKDLKSDYEMLIELTPIKKLQFIKIGNLQFLQSKAKLLQSSRPELNRLFRILEQSKRLVIQIEGHTDNIGDSDANVELSKARAGAVKEYLVNKGISPERVSIKGYGDAKPLNLNATEEERRANRRVEVRVLKGNKIN